jgi:hypothetical protein
MAQVDVEQMLNDKAAKAGEKLNWKTPIVDLLKLLELDSSLASRKELAKELNYTGDTNDGLDEHLAAPPGHEQAGRQRRQGARRSEGLK